MFKKLFDKLKKNDNVSQKIKEKNEENKIVTSKDHQKFEQGLKTASKGLDFAISQIAKNYVTIDEELFEGIEELLITYDVGITATTKILDSIIEEVKIQNIKDINLIKEIILDKLFLYYIQDTDIDVDINLKKDRTNIVLVVGVNGVGKTTSIAKIAHQFVKQGKKVLLIAGDTFRAGAVKQLEVWAQRLNVDIIKPDKEGQDPTSVIYNGLVKSQTTKYDLILIDTSGRLQNKVNLMNELKKISTAIQKFDPTAPHEVLLSIDATTGQSGVNQAKIFNEVVALTGIILTKMDSTSKGGIILYIKDALGIPVKFIGLGETLDDLQTFDFAEFIDGMVSEIK